MMKEEFERLAGYEVSDKDYYEIIEPMYYATSLNKAEFVKTVNKKRFALKPVKAIKAEMRKIAEQLKDTCIHYTDYDAKNKLAELAEEYIMRKYAIAGVKTASFYIHTATKYTCSYPVKVEIYGNKKYNTIEEIELLA